MKPTKDTTAQQFAQHLADTIPDERFAYAARGSGVAAWHPEAGWVCIFERTILDSMPWIRTNGHNTRAIVNGVPVDREWIEAKPAAANLPPIMQAAKDAGRLVVARVA